MRSSPLGTQGSGTYRKNLRRWCEIATRRRGWERNRLKDTNTDATSESLKMSGSAACLRKNLQPETSENRVDSGSLKEHGAGRPGAQGTTEFLGVSALDQNKALVNPNGRRYGSRNWVLVEHDHQESLNEWGSRRPTPNRLGESDDTTMNVAVSCRRHHRQGNEKNIK